MRGRAAFLTMSMFLLAGGGLAGCGSAHKAASTKPPAVSLKACLRSHGYTVEPETPQAVRTAPKRFEFLEVWNVVNPARVALALAISKSEAGAAKGAAWTRAENAKLGKGLISAPVVRIGKIDVLWTSKPGLRNATDVYGCVRPHA